MTVVIKNMAECSEQYYCMYALLRNRLEVNPGLCFHEYNKWVMLGFCHTERNGHSFPCWHVSPKKFHPLPTVYFKK